MYKCGPVAVPLTRYGPLFPSLGGAGSFRESNSACKRAPLRASRNQEIVFRANQPYVFCAEIPVKIGSLFFSTELCVTVGIVAEKLKRVEAV